MSIEVYAFDLDGTIINSGADIAYFVNEALKKFGYWTVDEEKIISFLGNGTKKLLLRALDCSTKNHFNLESDYNRQQFEKIYNFYFESYNSNPVVKTTLYSGIKKILNSLKEKDKKIVLITNKPKQIAQKIVEKLGLGGKFDVIIGGYSIDENGKKIELKPSIQGLESAKSRLNQKFNKNFTNKNFIMIGDSAVDIITGKKFGCMTVGCRDGLGDKEKMLSENPDLCFSVASEIEKFVDILSKDEIPSDMKKFAMQNEIPIIQDEGSDFIVDFIKKNDVKSVLEIGTAIGYSSVRFAKISPKIKLTTIEIDEERFEKAKKNVEESGLSSQITLIFGDALLCDLTEKFDLIFIDAAKAQYQKFFEKFKENLDTNGVIICDNLSFHGMVEDLTLTHNYSTKKLVKKIRKFIEFLKTNDEFETEFFKKGDGISVSKKTRVQKLKLS